MSPYVQRNLTDAVCHWGKLLFRICFTILCNRADAEDAVQESFVKYMTKAPAFTSEAHEKAWLIRVGANTAKNMALFRARHHHVNLEDVQLLAAEPEDRELLAALLQLPPKYKIVMDLFYVEGYRTKEIAGLIGLPETAVRKRLQKGRELLRGIHAEGSEKHERAQLCKSSNGN